MQGVILYGPPASGKTTITRVLEGSWPPACLYLRAKHGPVTSGDYRHITAHDLDELRARGQVIWENGRYDAVYVVDTPSLATALEEGVPVMHLGQRGGVRAVREAFPGVFTTVSLTCTREEAVARLRGRGSRDLHRRLEAWDSTEPLDDADLAIDTELVDPVAAAARIARHAGLTPSP